MPTENFSHHIVFHLSSYWHELKVFIMAHTKEKPFTINWCFVCFFSTCMTIKVKMMRAKTSSMHVSTCICKKDFIRFSNKCIQYESIKCYLLLIVCVCPTSVSDKCYGWKCVNKNYECKMLSFGGPFEYVLNTHTHTQKMLSSTIDVMWYISLSLKGYILLIPFLSYIT